MLEIILSYLFLSFPDWMKQDIQKWHRGIHDCDIKNQGIGYLQQIPTIGGLSVCTAFKVNIIAAPCERVICHTIVHLDLSTVPVKEHLYNIQAQSLCISP